jgi:class 3 adenylate cyclase/predicted ATPase
MVLSYESIEKGEGMRCHSCGSDNPEGVKFCIECAAPFHNRCPNCAFENLSRAKFCGECATPLTPQSQVQSPKSKVENGSASQLQTPSSSTHWTADPGRWTPPHLATRILAEQAAMEARGAREGERKTITALFADIKGSMDLIEPLDPEEARAIIDPALQLMMDAVHRYEGYVAQSTGDGIFALFGAPIACEDHPQRALYAALRMQEDGKRFAEQLRREKGVNLQVRVGLNTGEMVLRSIHKDDLHTDYLPVGHATSLASRMESLATPGSIVVSEHTYKLAEGYFDFKPLGAARVKGVSEPVNIYEVLGVGPLRTRLQRAATRGLTCFVGRQHELEQIRQAWEQAQAGRGQIVGVMGEPGIGKSRLFHEFVKAYGRSSPPSLPGCLILETFAVAHGKAYPYLPLIDLLKNYFQITVADDERKRREKVGGKVLMLDRSLEDTLPYVFPLLGITAQDSSLRQLDPQIRKRRTFAAIKRLLVRESLNQPLILICEDLHWLDAETHAFLTLLSESVATGRILLLVNYRPEYHPEWGNKTYYTQLRLDRLGREDAQQLLTVLVGDRTELQDLKRFILEKTEGNPFFMEEIIQALAEQGVLDGPGRVDTARLTAGVRDRLPSDLQLPPTVQAVLASRIDRLPPEEKEFLQTLSVIGKELPFGLLKQVANRAEDEIERLLSQLQAAEFIHEQSAFPQPKYIFKHALTQEVAYNSLLIERRKVLHERTAQAIELLFHSQLEDFYGDLAHHYSRSGNTVKAVEYLQRSGHQAAQRSAYTEAISHFTAALDLLEILPDTPERARQELTLQLALAVPLQATKGPAAAEVERAYRRARVLCENQGEASQLFSVLRGLWLLHHVRAELAKARELGEQLLSMAEQEQDPTFLMEAHRSLGSTLLWQGEFAPARAHLERSSVLYNPHLHRSLTFLHGGADPGVSCFCESARALWFLGYPEQALQRSQAALALAQGLSDPFNLGFALVSAAGLHQFRREGSATQQRAEEAIALASEQGLASLLAAATIRRGWALAEQGQVEAGLTQMQQGLAARQTTGAELAEPYFLALQAEVYGKVGQIHQALSLLADALTAVQTNGERRLEAELYRLKGQLTLKQSGVRGPESGVPNTQHPVAAEACFRKALEVARRQQAKSLELRAVTELSRLWQLQGKREEARRLLAEIYGWFTEGFDTADLQEAKALLEELGN